MPVLVTLLGLVLLSSSCARQAEVEPLRADWFAERAQESGIDFVHVNGMSGRLYMAEVLAPGVALFDYDNDGDLDVYLVQGEPLQPMPDAQGEMPYADERSRFSDRLYRNDLMIAADGARTLRFTDVTRTSGIDTPGYGMGVAAGDVDNDGWTDLYLTKFNAPNQLLRNAGNGTFVDVSSASGTDQQSWSVSASFVDVNRDGWLDLYVGNYVRYTIDGSTPCFAPSGAPDYCTPDAYPALPDRLYLNRGDGTFRDVSAQSGIAREFGPALGVSTADFDGDGWIDIYVANDGRENQLWINRHDGTFENRALLSGVALPITGKAEASMGVDAGDPDEDGDEDLFVTELTGEGSNFFVNDGRGAFEDRSAPASLGPLSLAYTGFGAAWFDADGDGRLDLLTVNGAVQTIERLRQAGDPFPLHQRKLLFRNVDGIRFEDVTAQAGPAFETSEVGRGAAFGDIDNDGDTDVLIGNNNGRARLLVNQPPAHHWIGLRLQGVGGRDMLGARVEITTREGAPHWRRVRADGSYGSANDPRVLVALGGSSASPDVRVTWPNGKVQRWSGVAIDRYTVLREDE
jgi:hypothetical protein